MRLPAAAVLRYELWACPGRTDAKIQIRLQRQTSCRLETGMDDCRSGDGHGGSILTPQAENKKWQAIDTRSTWKMQSWLENTSSAAFAMCIVQQLRSRYRLNLLKRPLAQYRLHGTLRPSRCICVVVQVVRNDRRPRAALRHGCKEVHKLGNKPTCSSPSRLVGDII